MAILLYCRFNDNVDDIISSNNPTATDISFSQGVHGKCAVFNGSTSKIVFPDISIFRFGTFSMSLTVKTADTAESIIFINSDGIRSNAVDIYMYQGNLGVSTNRSGSWYDCTRVTNIGDSKWHNLFFIYNGSSTMSVYVDGKYSTGSTALQAPNYSGTVYPTLGGRWNGSIFEKKFTGSQDEFIVWNETVPVSIMKNINARNKGFF